jgi:hypothetical protein
MSTTRVYVVLATTTSFSSWQNTKDGIIENPVHFLPWIFDVACRTLTPIQQPSYAPFLVSCIHFSTSL